MIDEKTTFPLLGFFLLVLCAFPCAGLSVRQGRLAETLFWSDEFNGTVLNPLYWSMDCGSQFNSPGNWSLETFTNRPENVFLSNGFLVIRALRHTNGGTNFTSGQVTTKGKFFFRYGRIEARMLLPYGYGMWPGFCMYGTNITSAGWPACGEIDIMEMRGGHDGDSNRTIMGTLHFGTNMATWQFEGRPVSLSGTNDFCDGFHVFGIIWDAEKIVYRLDGAAYYTNRTDGPLKTQFSEGPFYFYFNFKIGGLFFGAPAPTADKITAPFPQTMMVDWVRVYQTAEEETAAEQIETAPGWDDLIAGPNPFSPGTGRGSEDEGIIFDHVPEDAVLKIYSMAGTLVKVLYGSEGGGRVVWNVRNESGQECASGIYICLIRDSKGREKKIKLIITR